MNEQKSNLFSAEQSNSMGSVAAALQTTDQVDNEQITWNYNPHAITRSDSKTKQKENDDNVSYNCYSQTLNKLMGEFNVSKRKRNHNRNGDVTNAAKPIDNLDGVEKKSPMENTTAWSKNDDRHDGDETHFWSKVLSTNNNSQQNDLLACTSSASSANKSALNTAKIINSFNISNQSNNIDMNEVDAINCNLNKFPLASQTSLISVSSGSDFVKATYNDNSKNLVQKRKNIHQDKPNVHNENQFDNFTGNKLNRMTVNNDLSVANNTFLQALSDLRLDYNEMGATTNRSDRQESANSQSIDRYTVELESIVNDYT